MGYSSLKNWLGLGLCLGLGCGWSCTGSVSFCLLRRAVITGTELCCCVGDKAIYIWEKPVLWPRFHFFTSSMPTPHFFVYVPTFVRCPKTLLGFLLRGSSIILLFRGKIQLEIKASGRSHPITPASETDPKASGDVFFCHINEERIVFVSSKICQVGLNFVRMFPVRCMLSLHESSVGNWRILSFPHSNSVIQAGLEFRISEVLKLKIFPYVMLCTWHKSIKSI